MHRWVNGEEEFKVVHLSGSPSVGAGHCPFNPIELALAFFLWALKRHSLYLSRAIRLFTLYLPRNNEMSIQQPYCTFSGELSLHVSVHSGVSNHRFQHFTEQLCRCCSVALMKHPKRRTDCNFSSLEQCWVQRLFLASQRALSHWTDDQGHNF